jgi:hypothetical protein
MSPKTVALVLTGSSLIIFFYFLLIIILAVTGKLDDNVIGLYVIGAFILFIVSFIFDAIFVFVAPVRCNHEGCGERMHRAWIKENGFRLTYKCDRCGYIYDTNFTFGGDSYN